MYEQKPEFHRLTRARPQFGDAAASPVATRSEQASRARPGRSLLAPLTELSTELPPLLEALSTHLGQIAIVGYHRDAWDAAPGKLDVAGHAVHLQDFVSPNPPTVIVIADTGRRVTLRVVPPETDVATAAQAMSVAAHASVEATTGGRATKADASEARSLEELAERLSRLPGNTAPEQAALISQVGRRSRRPVHRRTEFRRSSRSSSSTSSARQLSKLRADRDARSARRTPPSPQVS